MSTETLTSVETFATDTAADLNELVQGAVDEGATVTITRADGKTATGTLAPHPTEPGLFKVVTGQRGRPLVFHPDDLTSVDFE